MGSTYTATAGPRPNGPGAKWPVACTCGWTRSVQDTDDRSRKTAEGWARAHLGEAHGVTYPIAHTRGTLYTATGWDSRLLTREEREHLVTLVHDANTGGGPQAPVRAMPKTGATSAGWLVLLGLLIVLVLAEYAQPKPHPVPILWTFLTVLLGGIVVMGVVGVRETRAWRQHRAVDYVTAIGYFDRVRAPRRLRDGSFDSGKSRKQMQHEWYGDHTELDWHDRERAEIWDLDAETYISNVLENDKD